MIYEIVRVCDSHDRYKLFEAYNKAQIFPAKKNLTFDSRLKKDITKNKLKDINNEDKK